MSVMPAEHASNGTAPPRAGEMSLDDLDELGGRIPFGDRLNQTVPASWASAMLVMLRDREPQLFVALMGEAATGYRSETAAKRGRSKASETA
jgi:hypothetical protein